jgi:hypothetical protein
MNKLKEAFIKSKHLRFKKEFTAANHKPYGITSDTPKPSKKQQWIR